MIDSGTDSEVVVRRFAGNAAWLLVAELVGKLAGFLFAIVVARGLGPTDYGYFTFALSIGSLLLMFGSLGLNIIVTREVARSPHRLGELISDALSSRFLLDLLAMVLAVAAGWAFTDTPRALVAVGLVGFALVIDDLTSLIGAVFKGIEAMRPYALAIFLNRAISTALAVAVVWWGGGLPAVSGVYLVGSLGGLVFAGASLIRAVPELSLRPPRLTRIKPLIGAGAPLGVSAVLNTAVFRLDSVMLQAMQGPFAVGMYGVAYRFFESLTFVAYSLASAALPRMSKGARSESSVRTFEATATAVLAVYLPIAVGAPFAGRWVVETIFSTRYSQAVPAVFWLASAVLFYGVAYLARVSAIALNRQRMIPRIAAVALVVNVGLNLWLIPTMSFEGAAIATFVTEVVECLLILMVLSNALGSLGSWRMPLVPAVGVTIMAGTLLVTGARDLAALAIGGSTYVVALMIFGRFVLPADTRRAVQIFIPRPGRGRR